VWLVDEVCHPCCRRCGTPAALALRSNTVLVELGLADNFLSAAAIAELATSLEKNTTLRSLNLAGVYRGDSAKENRDPSDTASSDAGNAR
jgi:hypothetical protein